MNNKNKSTSDDVKLTVTSTVTDDERNRNAFADRLRMSLPKGISQQKAADSIGVSISGFKKWLKGTTEPTLAFLPAIEALTGKSVQWLVTGVESPRGTPEEGLDPELMQLVILSLCQHLQNRKLWADVMPEDISKLSLVLYKLTLTEVKDGQKSLNLEAHNDIIKVILG